MTCLNVVSILIGPSQMMMIGLLPWGGYQKYMFMALAFLLMIIMFYGFYGYFHCSKNESLEKRKAVIILAEIGMTVCSIGLSVFVITQFCKNPNIVFAFSWIFPLCYFLSFMLLCTRSPVKFAPESKKFIFPNILESVVGVIVFIVLGWKYPEFESEMFPCKNSENFKVLSICVSGIMFGVLHSVNLSSVIRSHDKLKYVAIYREEDKQIRLHVVTNDKVIFFF